MKNLCAHHSSGKKNTLPLGLQEETRQCQWLLQFSCAPGGTSWAPELSPGLAPSLLAPGTTREVLSSLSTAVTQHSRPQAQRGMLTLPGCWRFSTALLQGKLIAAAIIDQRGSLLFSTAGALSRYLGDTESTRKLSTEHPHSPLEGPLEDSSSPITNLRKPPTMSRILYGKNFVLSCQFLGDQTNQD